MIPRWPAQPRKFLETIPRWLAPPRKFLEMIPRWLAPLRQADSKRASKT